MKRYRNLRAEMARHEVTVGDLAKFLKIRRGTVGDKLNGRSRFFYDEAISIRNHFFPNYDLEYLFENSDRSTA